jgi:hypothetical protein
MISYTTGEPLGNLEAGLAAAVTGSVRVSVTAGGIACVLGGVAVAVALPALWRYNSRPAKAAAGPADSERIEASG